MAGKLYFNNKYTEEHIAKYKKTGSIVYRDLAIKEIGKIIQAIINLYRYWRYEDRDVLENEGYIACLKAIEKFDPERFKSKSSLAFRYFSLVVKKHLAFITCKESKFKNRNLVTDDLIPYVEDSNKLIVHPVKEGHNDSTELIHFLNECLFFNLRKKLRIVKFLEKYLEMNQKHFDKKSFINYVKSYGITQSYIRKILKDIENSEQLYDIYNRHNHSNYRVTKINTINNEREKNITEVQTEFNITGIKISEEEIEKELIKSSEF
jgi:hypothetical protein